jgi:hypothetical protein
MAQYNSQNNVLFMGVARIAGQAVVICSHSFNSETDLGSVKQVLEQPNMNLVAGKHYSFNVSTFAWHLIAGK